MIYSEIKRDSDTEIGSTMLQGCTSAQGKSVCTFSRRLCATSSSAPDRTWNGSRTSSSSSRENWLSPVQGLQEEKQHWLNVVHTSFQTHSSCPCCPCIVYFHMFIYDPHNISFSHCNHPHDWCSWSQPIHLLLPHIPASPGQYIHIRHPDSTYTQETIRGNCLCLFPTHVNMDIFNLIHGLGINTDWESKVRLLWCPWCPLTISRSQCRRGHQSWCLR